MSVNQRQSARKFREYWTLAKDSEVGGYQKFWISLLGDVLGMEDVMARISFQSPVQLKDTTKFLDAWIPETRVLIEHKARNVKLDAPLAGHDGKTPFEQALEYNIARPYSEKARWIVTCNFSEIWVYDMDHPLEDPQKILLANLPKEISRLGFLVDTSVKIVREKEMDISIKAGRIVGELYRELLKRYGSHAESQRGGERGEGGKQGEIPQTPSAKPTTKTLCDLGFSAPLREKTIFDNGKAIPAAHINGYLMDAQDVWIESRTKPLCDVPEIGIGNKPIDGGNYLFTKEEKDEFLKKELQAARYFHPWYGADEFLNGSPRYCLWLGDCALADLFQLPECLKRVESVRAYRLASKSPGTRKIADKPTRFHVENFPKGHYIVIPEVSSEKRRYVPMGYLSHEAICSNKLRLMPDASLYHFGVLNSIVHNAWVRAVCGRLETRYDYSINIVYNNFPWPQNPVNPVNHVQKTSADSAPLREKISRTAQAILDARVKYPGVTLAQMYGDKMYLFPELVAAHTANDRAVLAAYGLKPDTPEPEIVAHLFGLYAEMTKEMRA